MAHQGSKVYDGLLAYLCCISDERLLLPIRLVHILFNHFALLQELPLVLFFSDMFGSDFVGLVDGGLVDSLADNSLFDILDGDCIFSIVIGC